MDLVRKFCACLTGGVALFGFTVFAQAETEENESETDEPMVVDEQLDSDESENVEAENTSPTEEVSSNDEETKESVPSQTYTRLPVQTQINPNKNVDLPQDI